ncbi:hypothetical protein, partial [Sporosarcina limicola]|uniref:hypothetical protein n=1 Tax=Sporosarcina limicola TaxID=34101 RepID=UPI001789574B
MKFFKSLQIFLIAILIIGIAIPNSTEAATAISNDLMNIKKTVSKNSLVKGETTDVTLTVKGALKDSTFVKSNDVFLIVDKSGSMGADNRLTAAKEATKVIGSVDVKLLNADGQMAVLTKGFTHTEPGLAPAPEITSLSEDSISIGKTKNIFINAKNFKADS